MIEVEVHRQLKDLLRRQPGSLPWPHQLTMARLVARSLSTGRSALIQVTSRTEYRLSYFLPALSWPQSLILAVSAPVREQLLTRDLPFLRAEFALTKPLVVADHWPEPGWQGVLITDPVVWLKDRLTGGTAFPEGVPVVVDRAHELETWVQEALGLKVYPYHWQEWRDCLLMSRTTQRGAEEVLELSTRMAHHVLSQSAPQQSWPPELQADLSNLLERLEPDEPPWSALERCLEESWALWAEVHRSTGQFTLHCTPVQLEKLLAQNLWSRQPVVLIGESLDPQKQATAFRERLGLEALTCLQFPPDRNEEEINLYIPTALPDQTSPHFWEHVQPLIGQLVLASLGAVVILVDSWSLQQQVATCLAAQFGSRVGVRTLDQSRDILVCDWDFWERHWEGLPLPHTLVLANLPLPSWEHPLVQAKVEYLKREHRDWFREYLLPVALGRLQRAANTLRKNRGLVALLDSRVLKRSYGPPLLDSLAPARRIHILDRALEH
ncbi:helicase C-terminal domain-containing protein [Anthocerotibacter panamensis]|uniref:helicase C-terminal domain-containing protein n=1 Tax=Anthocerotibacter panamensis TaxID=2857077 RepID=UPI001C408BD6|nr:helicase C-terminal domain-containing protein [Anthocerotibacter panamensis]